MQATVRVGVAEKVKEPTGKATFKRIKFNFMTPTATACCTCWRFLAASSIFPTGLPLN